MPWKVEQVAVGQWLPHSQNLTDDAYGWLFMLFFLLIHESAIQIKDLFCAIREPAKKLQRVL